MVWESSDKPVESVTVRVTLYSPLSGKLRSISLPSYSLESPSKFQKKDKSSPSSSEEPDAEKEMVSLIWILGLEGVIGIKELKLFQDGNDEYASGRKLYYYKADGEVMGTDSNYGFRYNFENSLRDGIYRPSVSPSV